MLRVIFVFLVLLGAAACGARTNLGASGEAQADATSVSTTTSTRTETVDEDDGDIIIIDDDDGEEDPDEPIEVPPECDGPDVTFIYVVTSDNRLLAYRPGSNTFETKGTLDCPSGGSTPFSMAVSRDAVARVLYTNGRLYEVDIADASCASTAYDPPIDTEAPFFQFGMGYAANPNDDGESLYVADISFDEPSAGLARIDTETYERTFIGPFSDNPGNALELTPTGLDGPLFGYFLNTGQAGGTLVQIDTDTANILDSTEIGVGSRGSSLAVAWWGGDFFVFIGDGNRTEVNRYDPETDSVAVVNSLAGGIVGAGVSTCAPDELP